MPVRQQAFNRARNISLTNSNINLIKGNQTIVEYRKTCHICHIREKEGEEERQKRRQMSLLKDFREFQWGDLEVLKLVATAEYEEQFGGETEIGPDGLELISPTLKKTKVKIEQVRIRPYGDFMSVTYEGHEAEKRWYQDLKTFPLLRSDFPAIIWQLFAFTCSENFPPSLIFHNQDSSPFRIVFNDAPSIKIIDEQGSVPIGMLACHCQTWPGTGTCGKKVSAKIPATLTQNKIVTQDTWLDPTKGNLIMGPHVNLNFGESVINYHSDPELEFPSFVHFRRTNVVVEYLESVGVNFYDFLMDAHPMGISIPTRFVDSSTQMFSLGSLFPNFDFTLAVGQLQVSGRCSSAQVLLSPWFSYDHHKFHEVNVGDEIENGWTR
ncbi:hypothetical protein VKT23_010014 [Stygiomarasmius scandens]|uniref:Uncharacterized protein n=1 Tax=Marasmiellus scandens TaxID=2682957 RepID=A0ABR1JDS5_9AGAR